MCEFYYIYCYLLTAGNICFMYFLKYPYVANKNGKNNNNDEMKVVINATIVDIAVGKAQCGIYKLYS